MSPTIVLGPDGKFKYALGSPGGPLIIDYVAQSLIGLIDGRLTPQQASALPHAANLNSPTLLEKDTALESLAAGLGAMGHTVATPAVEKSGLQIVERVKGGYIGGADPRRDGVAMGD